MCHSVLGCIQPSDQNGIRADTHCDDPLKPAPTSSASSPVFVYGIGADWALSKHLGLRLQYRGNMHPSPALTTALSSTKVEGTTYEPMFGVFYRF